MACLLFILSIIIPLFFLSIKICLKLNTRRNNSSTCLLGKTTLITGANTGIGYYTALDFATRGARVILACRNEDKAKEARNKIIQRSGNCNVVVKIVDLSSLTSVRKFAKDINATEDRLDILVNNAGVAGVDDVTTTDGLNLFMQSNYFGPFLLTNLLVGLLKKSAPSRIVNLSSATANLAKLDVNNLNAFSKTIFKLIDYANTKLCKILFANELARKLKSSDVTVNSVHPGFVYTQLYRHLPIYLLLPVRLLAFLFCKTLEEGAQTSIYVSVAKEIEGVTGEFFENCRIAWCPPMPKIARDQILAKRLWEKSEIFVKLTSEERSA